MTDDSKPLGPAAQAFMDRALIRMEEPKWSAAHERAVERAHVTLVDSELVREAEEIERLTSTPEGSRTLASRMAAKALRYADMAAKNVKYVGSGKTECRPAPDTRTALQGIRDAAEYLGVAAPKATKLEITGDVSRLTDEEVEARIHALVAASAKAPPT